MKIFIDFDDVIFNTKKFKQDLIGIFERFGVSREEFRDAYYTFSSSSKFQGRHYDNDAQIKTLEKRKKIDGKKLKAEVDRFMANLSVYVFPDVGKFLREFPKKDLFILSYGQPKFQKSKIKGAGVGKLVDKVFITKRKKVVAISELARKYAFSQKEAMIMIEDHPQQIAGAKKCQRRIVTFHLSRKEGRYCDLPCVERDYAVKNLMAVARIIKKEKMN